MVYAVVTGDHSTPPNHDKCLTFFAAWFWAPVEAFLIASMATTPGKKLFNIYVKNSNGEKLTLKESFTRSFYIVIFAQGFGIPLFSMIQQILTFFKLKRGGNTTWDKEMGTQVVCKKNSPFKIAAVVAGVGVFVFLCVLETQLEKEEKQLQAQALTQIETQ